jgi:hypothetical protein
MCGQISWFFESALIFICHFHFGEAMEYNPFAVQYKEVKAEITQIKARQQSWLQQLNWHAQFDAQGTFAALARLERESSRESQELRIYANEGSRLLRRLTDLKENGEPWYKIWSDQRSAEQAEIKGIEEKLSELRHMERGLKDHIETLNEEASKRKAETKRYHEFDHLHHQAAIRAGNLQLPALEARLMVLKPKMEKVNRHIYEVVNAMETLQTRKTDIEYIIAEVSRLDDDLTCAEDRRARAMIHEDCQARFGDSRPAKVFQRKTSELGKIERDIEKLEKRILREVALSSRDLQQLIFDGNNLCYSGDGVSTFIGLAAIVEAVDDLACTGSIVVVFDASIRRLLGISDAEIHAHFPEYVEVHVVANKEKADETVLTLAKDSEVFVVSNDHYADFPDQPAVEAHRIIRHEITRERVMIHELKVDRSYSVGKPLNQKHPVR